MSTPCNLLLLNPLTAIFLSGVATQITFIVYFNNSHLTGKSTVICSNSHRRIIIWQQLFHTYCKEYFTEYSEAHEKKQFDSKINLHPFIVHANLLIKYSMIILNLCQVQKIGNVTKMKIQKWFKLIRHIINSKVWTHHISIQKINALYSLVEKHANMRDEDMGSGTKNDFIEFNPVALFIRSSFIVNIHKTDFCTKTFNSWEQCNCCILSKYINIHDYLADFSLENKPHNFSSEFPIINHLPCMEIYKMWDVSAQRKSSIPFHKIFTFILQLINGKMMTLHYHQRNQFILPSMNEKVNIVNFNKFCKMANFSMNKEFNNIKNNEKQKKHHMLKKQKFYGNNYYHNEYHVDGKNFFSCIFGTNFYSTQINSQIDDAICMTDSRGMCQINRVNSSNNNNKNSAKLSLVSHQHSHHIKHIEYIKQNKCNTAKEDEKKQYQNRKDIIARRSQMRCKKKDDITELQETNDDILEQLHGNLFVRSCQRRQLVESNTDRIKKSRKHLKDEDPTFQRELESIKIVSSRKGRASNLDGAIKVNQIFQRDLSIITHNDCESSFMSKTFLNSKVKERKTSFICNNQSINSDWQKGVNVQADYINGQKNHNIQNQITKNEMIVQKPTDNEVQMINTNKSSKFMDLSVCSPYSCIFK